MDRFPKLKRLSGQRLTRPMNAQEDPITMKEFTNHRKSRCTILLSTGRHKPDNQYASPQWHISSFVKVVAILDDDRLHQTEKSRRGAVDYWENEAEDDKKMIKRRKRRWGPRCLRTNKRPAKPMIAKETVQLHLYNSSSWKEKVIIYLWYILLHFNKTRISCWNTMELSTIRSPTPSNVMTIKCETCELGKISWLYHE